MEEIDRLRKKIKQQAEKNIERLSFRKGKTNLERLPKANLEERRKPFDKKRGESELFDTDNSDIPVHEKFVKEQNIKELKKKRKLS